MNTAKLLLLAGILLLAAGVNAQSRSIKGIVKDKAGNAVVNATVKLKGATSSSATNTNGEFNIDASAGDVLEVSIIGFKTSSVTVGSESFIMITLEPNETTLQDVVLVGTRTTGRVKMETPVPVDIVNMNQASIPTGRMDVTSILNFSVPSFNYNKQSGSDGADHIDLATLRGLGPDQTLVLVNGKRRHQTAFVAVFGTRGRGNSGTDLSAIPVGAIDRVEVLRDGASAQYGSDAIAGVINIVTKKSTGHFSGNFGWSSYIDDEFNPATKPELGQYVYGNKIDGQAFSFNGNTGFKIGNGGFLNITANMISQGKTYRQALETNDTKDNYLPTNIYRRAHGDGSMTGGGGFINLELPSSSKTSFYAFGGLNYKASDAYAFTRNWSARPDRFPTTNSGGIDFVPSIMRTTADADTFFNPRIKTHILDGSLAAGFKGKTDFQRFPGKCAQ
jgi:iron complex outermembrane recepter protein